MGVDGFKFEEALRNCGCDGVELLTVRFGVDLFLSSLGVEDRSLRNDATDGERERLLLLEDEGREFGVLNGVREGEDSSREVE